MEEVQLHPVFGFLQPTIEAIVQVLCYLHKNNSKIPICFKKYGNESPEFQTHDTGKNLHICASATKFGSNLWG